MANIHKLPTFFTVTEVWSNTSLIKTDPLFLLQLFVSLLSMGVQTLFYFKSWNHVKMWRLTIQSNEEDRVIVKNNGGDGGVV